MKLYEPAQLIHENTLITINIKENIDFDVIKIASSCFYTVYYNNEVVQFGPSRGTFNHLRINNLKLNGNTRNLVIKIIYYGFPTFDLECRKFIFGIELFKNEKLILETKDLGFAKDFSYISDSNKFSFQRGLIERHDLENTLSGEHIELKECEDAYLLDDVKDPCKYEITEAEHIFTKLFEGFHDIYPLSYLATRVNKYDASKIVASFKNNYIEHRFKFDKIYSGLISVDIDSPISQTVYVVFDEYLPDNNWIYSRDNCNDLIEIKLHKGLNHITSVVPYTFMHLMVLTHETNDVKAKVIKIQNDEIKTYKTDNDEINKILEASSRSFAQNAVDLFTDCPGRERAGWLCDSYFEGIAEEFYTGTHNIEKRFLENFIYEDSPEIVKGMVPMCYPSIHEDKTFIPNWGLWFIVEIDEYFKRTNDIDLVNKLKTKVYDLLHYFEKFENEYGLLEDLESWVFVEWSEATNDEYIKPVSFASNMLYKGTLDSAYRLYKDEKFAAKAAQLKKTINEMSFNGEYYVDNAKRVDSKLVVTPNLISETCQYYACFFNVSNEDFYKRIREVSNVRKLKTSALFIGEVLRLTCLYRHEDYAKVVEEIKEYFTNMANATSTLWEKDQPRSSCNHGFASIVGALLFDSYNKINK